MKNKNIVKEHYSITRKDRNKSNKHQSFVIWFTGLSGSGKSTLANQLEDYLHHKGLKTYVLDGDNIRSGLNADLDFTTAGRKENLRRIAETAKLFVDAGTITLAAFISPLQSDREQVKEIIGKADFVEVYVKASLDTCEKRDVKGLYKKARQGEIKNFTGISAPYEEPKNPDIVIDSTKENIEDSLKTLIDYINSKIVYSDN